MRGLTDLSEKECHDLLTRCSVGRVSFATPLGPRTVPINYAMDGWAIVFRTTPYSELGTYGADAEVVFEVDEVDAAQHAGQSVVAYGRAHVLDAKELLHVSWTGEPQPWAGGRRDRYFRIETREVTGRRVGGERDVVARSDASAGTGRAGDG